MVDIIHKIGIQAPLAEVRKAVSTVAGVAGWWTRETTGEAKPGGAVQVRFTNLDGTELGKIAFEVLATSSDTEVRWRIVSGPEEWLATEVTFTLSQRDNLTTVVFGHRNWREAVEFMAHCSMKWATFLLSLRQFVETGTGRPAPDDLKIDDWN